MFGARGRNDLVFRERFGSEAGRHYALCDNMGSKVAITNVSGTVVERYAFTAFGDLESIMAADYTPRASSLYHWETLFHGELRDQETGFYNYGYRYYTPMLGRWPSRDPIGEVGGVNLYGFVGNNGINRWDYLGNDVFGDWTKEDSCRVVDEWHKKQMQDKDWLKDVPDCPDKLCKDKDGAIVPCTGDDWSDPEPASQKYHPGASHCMRSKSKGPGQQCCYDEDGNLIKDGEGAGTPDRVSPNGIGGVIGHYFSDVDIYSFAKHCGEDGLKKYREARPPSQGGGKCDCPCDAKK